MKDQLSKLTIPQNATIKDALERLNETKKQIVFLVDSDNRVLGCITDGDIRRTLLRGEPITALAEKAARKTFVSASKKTPLSTMLKLMNENGVRQIPILDSNQRLIDVRLIEEFVNNTAVQFDFPAVIMAGGRGSRLAPHTATMPKPLLKVGDRTLIERIIGDLHKQGVRKFYVTVNYLAQQIMDHLGDGSRFGCSIEYIHEQEATPLGTAGSLALLKGKLHGNFLVTNGDVLSTLDVDMLSRFHLEHNAIATVCAKVFTVNIPYGVVRIAESNVLGIDEKPDFPFLVNAGVYFFSQEVLDQVRDNERLDMPSLLERLIAAGRNVKCFQSSEPWLDVGSQVDFERAQKNLEYLVR